MTTRRKRIGSERRPKQGGAAPRPLVLIVEDNRDARELYAGHFESQGFRVVTVSDGDSGIRVASELLPDIIVMDLSLPSLDGWEATRRLKGQRLTAHIPIVACTAHAFGPSVERALVAGCDAYMVKPCLPADLEREVLMVLARVARAARRPA